ncbi:hypothetical protein PW089_19500, partial [Escherichia coli]
ASGTGGTGGTGGFVYIYEKLHSGGGRNSCNPLLMELSAPSNFYARAIKKMRHAGGHDADMLVGFSFLRRL